MVAFPAPLAIEKKSELTQIKSANIEKNIL